MGSSYVAACTPTSGGCYMLSWIMRGATNFARRWCKSQEKKKFMYVPRELHLSILLYILNYYVIRKT